MAGLARLGEWVDGIAAALHLDTAPEYALRLCVEEAAANVVMHGTLDSADAGYVALRVAAGPEALRIMVEDTCGAFDPLAVPPPERPASLEEARIGGLGIHLMRQYAQKIDYERSGGTNRLMLMIPRTRQLAGNTGEAG